MWSYDSMIVLYHDDEPEGRAFDQDSADQALRVGWYKKKKEKLNELSDSKRPRARRSSTVKRAKPKRDTDSGGLTNSPERPGEPIS
jgi:hypothetical protein